MQTDRSVYQLVYVSSASAPLSADDLCNIATVSEANNDRLAITGVLLYADGRFLQFLEGDRHDVGGKFEAIRHDHRHHSIYVMRRRFIPARQFGAWFMRLTTPDELATEAGDVYSSLFDGAGSDPQQRPFAVESWSILSAFSGDQPMH